MTGVGSFDTGTFLILLGLGIFVLISFKTLGKLYLLAAAGIFILLGTVIIAGYDVVFVNTTSDGHTTLTQTSWFISNTMNNQSVQFMGYVLLILGLIAGVKFLVTVADKDDTTPFL